MDEVSPGNKVEQIPVQPSAPETRRELQPEQPEIQPEQPPLPTEVPEVSPPPIVPVPPPTVPVASLELTASVEQALSEGMEETFQKLDPETQTRFKRVGEETAVTIAGLLQETKIQTKKIIDLIIGWLLIIPGINKFFLQQEAKIKTDKVLALRQPPK